MIIWLGLGGRSGEPAGLRPSPARRASTVLRQCQHGTPRKWPGAGRGRGPWQLQSLHGHLCDLELSLGNFFVNQLVGGCCGCGCGCCCCCCCCCWSTFWTTKKRSLQILVLGHPWIHPARNQDGAAVKISPWLIIKKHLDEDDFWDFHRLI